MILREAHLEAFARAAEETFIDRLVAHLQSSFPEASGRLGEAGVRATVIRGRERARTASLISERAVADYLELCFRHGLETNDPRMRDILDDGSLTEIEKLAQLEEAAGGAA